MCPFTVSGTGATEQTKMFGEAHYDLEREGDKQEPCHSWSNVETKATKQRPNSGGFAVRSLGEWGGGNEVRMEEEETRVYQLEGPSFRRESVPNRSARRSSTIKATINDPRM